MEDDEILLKKINHSRIKRLLFTLTKFLLISILMFIAFDTNSLVIILGALLISIGIFAFPGLKKFDSSDPENEIKEGELSSMKFYSDLLYSS